MQVLSLTKFQYAPAYERICSYALENTENTGAHSANFKFYLHLGNAYLFPVSPKSLT